jgi:O-6-methylguanine DNA methyltransferase
MTVEFSVEGKLLSIVFALKKDRKALAVGPSFEQSLLKLSLPLAQEKRLKLLSRSLVEGQCRKEAQRVFLEDLQSLGTHFQRSIWKELLKVSRGTTLSYSELAKRIGRPRASRAVANAVAANPYHWVVPCHRVIQKNGALGGFAAGPELKEQLLRDEGVTL